MNFFTFMGEHPYLTFFLAIILTRCVVRSIAAASGYYDDMGHCDDCKCGEDEI